MASFDGGACLCPEIPPSDLSALADNDPANAAILCRGELSMVVRCLKVFSLAIASWYGLFVMNFFVFALCLRIVVRVIIDADGGPPLSSETLESLMESVTIRLITVGVVMLERHEIIEMIEGKHASDRSDPLADISQPYGMYYLCGGLVMECFVDGLKHPFPIIQGPAFEAIFVSVLLLCALVTIIVSLRYA